MLLQSFFDPAHGFLSSFDEWFVALVAVVVLTVVGAAAEYLWDAKGGTVLAATVGYVAALFVWTPPFISAEWHYALLVAVPLVVVSYLSRGSRERAG